MVNIRNLKYFQSSFWDWSVFNDCFGNSNIRITDIDGLVERHGYFLLIETKLPAIEVPQGQAILFDAISKNKNWNVLVIWGETNNPLKWKLWRHPKIYYGGLPELRQFIYQWFLFAEKQNKA